MIIKPKFGSVAEIEILRRKKGGRNRIDKIGRFGNAPSSWLIIRGSTTYPSHIRGSDSSSFYFQLKNSSDITKLDGTFSQSGNTLIRETGDYSFSSSTDPLFFFEDGTKAGYRLSGSGESITTSRSNEIPPGNLYSFNQTFESNVGLNVSHYPSRSYQDGVFTVETQNRLLFPQSSSEFYLRGMSQSMVSYNNATSTISKISPTLVNVGDVVVIENFKYIFDQGFYKPIRFIDSPIAGIAGSGLFQRMLRINDADHSFTPNRIYLISYGNEIVLPDAKSNTDTYLNPSSLTVSDTITASNLNSSPSFENDGTSTNRCSGTIGSNISNIKQIAWGSTTQIHGIIEYDTPISLESGKVLTVGMSTHYDFDISIP